MPFRSSHLPSVSRKIQETLDIQRVRVRSCNLLGNGDRRRLPSGDSSGPNRSSAVIPQVFQLRRLQTIVTGNCGGGCSIMCDQRTLNGGRSTQPVLTRKHTVPRISPFGRCDEGLAIRRSGRDKIARKRARTMHVGHHSQHDQRRQARDCLCAVQPPRDSRQLRHRSTQMGAGRQRLGWRRLLVGRRRRTADGIGWRGSPSNGMKSPLRDLRRRHVSGRNVTGNSGCFAKFEGRERIPFGRRSHDDL